MPRKSTLKTLPKPIKVEVDRLIREGETIDSIVGFLRSKGAERSRSAVGRYKQSAEQQMERYRQAQDIAKVWIARMGEEPDGDVGRLLVEMLRTVAWQTLGQLGEKDEIKPDAVMFLGKAIKDVASADKIMVDRVAKIRAEERQKVAKEITETAVAQGMDRDQAAFWRKQVLQGL